MEDEAGEVVRMLEPDDVKQLVEEASAVPGSPVVVALVDEDDEASVLALGDIGERLKRPFHGSTSLFRRAETTSSHCHSKYSIILIYDPRRRQESSRNQSEGIPTAITLR